MASRRRPAKQVAVRTESAQDGFYLVKKNGERTRLTNFSARIVEDIVHESGGVGGLPRRSFTLRAQVKGGPVMRFTITQEEFESMKWVAPHLGARAIIFTVRGSSPTKVRHAIQEQSRQIRQRVIYHHIGWEKIAGRWTYLHADGGIGSRGPVEGITVEPPEGVTNFKLPATREAWVRTDVGSSLNFLEAAPDIITLPLFAAIWRAISGRTNFSIHICGKTGNRKTQLACLMQQHFGPTFDDKHLPASFIGTPHSLVETTHMARDAVLVVDDYVPSTPGAQGKEMRESANRLFRALGNTAGRSRLAGGGLRRDASPRSLLVTTGEELPDGLSIRGRILFIEVGEGQVRLPALTALQEAARDGYMARAVAHYVRWMASRYSRLMEALPDRLEARRAEMRTHAAHARTPEILANIDIGLEDFSRFAVDVGALPQHDANQLRARFRAILPALAAMQRRIIVGADPAARFLLLVASAIRAGDAHVNSITGAQPPPSYASGWEQAFPAWRTRGPCVGWLDEDDLLLDFEAAYPLASRAAAASGEPLGVTPVKLKKLLHQGSLLRTVDETRRTLTIRKTLQGERREVIHVAATPLRDG